ncbi:MAG: FAD-dependent oxidoreductase [Rhodocyclaceae bacterium]|nr:FAD-dependent oxidoreductase [Rhodocyclaceae bacterium]
MPYSRLVLALGADPIRLALAGDAADAVLSVNDLADYARFREALKEARGVAILGAGLIGCEFANDLAAAGHAVTVLDPAAWPLASLLPQPAGEALLSPLAALGVSWRLGRAVKAVDRDGSGFRLTLDNGDRVDADLVLSAVGLRPRIALAKEAGLAVNRGILADALLRTSDADIFALGDCAEIEGQVRPTYCPSCTPRACWRRRCPARRHRSPSRPCRWSSRRRPAPWPCSRRRAMRKGNGRSPRMRARRQGAVPRRRSTPEGFRPHPGLRRRARRADQTTRLKTKFQ